jgi:hypothetical protein
MWGAASGGGGYGITSDTTDTGHATSGVNQYIGGINAPAVGNQGVPVWLVALGIGIGLLVLLKK